VPWLGRDLVQHQLRRRASHPQLNRDPLDGATVGSVGVLIGEGTKKQPLCHAWLRALTGVTLLLAGCSRPQRSDSEAVTAAFNAIWTRYSSSLNAGDLDSWLSLWTDDGVQLPPGEPPVVGKDQIRARNKGVLDKFTVNLSITNDELGVAGDWAFARGTYTATLTPKKSGPAIPINGKYITILKRQADGSWKIHRDIFNSNVPSQ